jgi:hypothetical protein
MTAIGREARAPQLTCDDEHFCDPLMYCLLGAPKNQPWAPSAAPIEVEGRVRQVVVVNFPGKAPGVGGKRALWRHCPFCGAVIDPTLGPPKRWWQFWRRG